MNPFKVFSGLVMVMLGISLLALSTLSTSNYSNSEYGMVLIIGPFPIILASSPQIAILLIFLVLIAILLPVLLWR